MQSKPGRICRRLVNECARADLNTCDLNADCTDKADGYECKCRNGFFDISPTPNAPGTSFNGLYAEISISTGRACKAIVNECADPNLNDCHTNAICTDTLGIAGNDIT